MAATIVRQGVIGSDEVKALMSFMKWDEARALGTLLLLWHGSQKRMLVKATARQILYWCRVEDEQEGARLIDALCDELCGFLERKGEDCFQIVGNRKEVTKLKTWKRSSKNGGKKTREKWRGKKAESNPTEDAEPQGPANGPAKEGQEPEADSVPSSSLFSSSLISSLLFSSSRKSKTGSLAREGSEAKPGDVPTQEDLEGQERLKAKRRELGFNPDGSTPHGMAKVGP